MNKDNFHNRIFNLPDDDLNFDNHKDSDNDSDYNTKNIIQDKYKETSSVSSINDHNSLVFNHEDTSNYDKELKDLLSLIGNDAIFISQRESFSFSHLSPYPFEVYFYSSIIIPIILIFLKIFFVNIFNAIPTFLIIPYFLSLIITAYQYKKAKTLALNFGIPNIFVNNFLFKLFKIKNPFKRSSISYSTLENKEIFEKLYIFFKNRPEEDIYLYFQEYMRYKNPEKPQSPITNKFKDPIAHQTFNHHLFKLGLYISSIIETKTLLVNKANKKHKTVEDLEKSLLEEHESIQEQNLTFFNKTKENHFKKN